MATMQSRRDAEARSIAEQAAEWLLVLEDGRPEDQEAFSEWLARSPLHVGAFLRASAVDSLLGEVDREKSITLDTGPFGEGANVTALASAAEAPARPERRSTWRWAIAASIGVAALALSALFLLRPFAADPWKQYSTAVGEQRAVELEDGSVVFLGPDSRIDVQFDATERQVRLATGQAVFRVHRDAARPFSVRSGRTVAQALGTEFDVHRVRGDSVVTVLEGVVEVSHERTLMQSLAAPLVGAQDLRPVKLTAGEEIRVASDGRSTKPARAAVDHMEEWTERRLTFVNEPLFTIADEFNRYNRVPKILVEDATAGGQRYAAAFDADDPESLVVVLEKDPRLRVERRGTDIVIRARETAQ